MAVVDLQRSPLTKRTQRLRRPQRVARIGLTALLGTIIVTNLAASVAPGSSFVWAHLSAALLAAYLLLESRIYLRRCDAFGLLSPAFLAISGHFVLSYLIGISIAVFDPAIIARFDYWVPELDTALAGTMFLAGLAAFCMLRGYGLAQLLARSIRRSVQRSQLFRTEIRSYFSLVLIVQAAFVLFVALAIKLGIFGMVGTEEARQQYAAIREFLRLSIAAGTLSYFLILLRYFARRAQGRVSLPFSILCALMIVVHVGVGAVSGFKSQMVFPFVIAGLAFFLATHRMPARFIWLSAFALVLAYAVIEPYRAYLGVQGPQRSVGETLDAFVTAVQEREELGHHTDLSLPEQIASRFDLAGMSTVGIDYVIQGHLRNELRKQFQESILFAPVLAYVPRAVWSDKPSYSPGVWFNRTVLGRKHDTSTSVGMGPIAYLYMTGGILTVCLGFFLFGALQALIFNGLARAGAGGLIVYLTVASTLVMIPTSYGPALTGVLRMLPVATVAQFLMLRARSRTPTS